MNVQKQPASYFAKISVLFFQERLFKKDFQNTSNFPKDLDVIRTRRRHNSFIKTHQIFKENQIYYKNTYKFTKNIKISQESFFKILQEHIRFSRRRKYLKNRFPVQIQISNFPGDLVQSFVRTHKTFQEKEIPQEQIDFSRKAFSKFSKNRYDFPGDPQEQIFCKITSLDAFERQSIYPGEEIFAESNIRNNGL